ncbi:hypothetical protein AYI68_g1545 [Smittium mucronatum]|uniref:rRNA-processing protein FYV7 n=1 Tax=Smittium mucronatum TaxID=133383 RepID=A0A1R0H597_9FUNG|nr:hypothetical protein AYI68_g1545 [Smittium mucronatum]
MKPKFGVEKIQHAADEAEIENKERNSRRRASDRNDDEAEREKEEMSGAEPALKSNLPRPEENQRSDSGDHGESRYGGDAEKDKGIAAGGIAATGKPKEKVGRKYERPNPYRTVLSIQQEEREAKERERQRRLLDIEESKKKNAAKRKHRKMESYLANKKTRKGQPNMGSKISMLLSKIENNAPSKK